MMFTLFTTPKPFQGHIGVIQRNALRSWKRLHPDVEVMLFGDDEGAAESLEVLDHRHALLFDRDGRAGAASQHPVQQGHATSLSSWRPGTPSPRLVRCRPLGLPGLPARSPEQAGPAAVVLRWPGLRS